MNTFDQVDMSEAFGMFHDYVIQEFGEQEYDLVIVAGQFSKDVGCKLNLFLGNQYKQYGQLPVFTKWFSSQVVPQTVNGIVKPSKVMIKAKPGKATQISGTNIVSAIKAKIPPSKQHPVVTKTIPVRNHLELGEGLHFFGIFYPESRKEKDLWKNDRNYSEVRFVKVERELEQLPYNIELGPSFVGYAVKGEFVVGESSKGEPRLLDRSHRAIMFRSWLDFEESKEYDSLQKFLVSGRELKLTPQFKTKYGEILIFDECFLYAGFRMDMETRVMNADEVRVSVERYPDLDAVRSIIYLFENRDDFHYGIGFTVDKFMIGCPFRSRWQSTDAFFADQSFWKKVDAKEGITEKKILKECLVILQDGKWHDRVDFIKELNERILGMSESGITDGDVLDMLKKCEYVKVLEDSTGNWSVQKKLPLPPPPPPRKKRFFCGENEEAFLRSFIDDVCKCGYDYRPEDIIRFHTSVKSGSFTLLGGAPGSGKSTLVSLYAKALAKRIQSDQEDVQYLTIDVNPSWIDPNDVLGYWNLKGEYSCASSGLVPFLRKSSKSNGVCLVCIEEMNLARVEHYFSNFIQLMSREPDDRVLLGVPSEKDGSERDMARLTIPKNIRFVGTNNFDETTQRFSSRFYDRCSYIELQKTEHVADFPEWVPSQTLGEFNYGVSFDEYNKWRVHEARVTSLHSSVVDKFKKIVEKLCKLNLQPSVRVKLAILEYLLSRPFFDGCGSEYSSAADCQLIALDEAIAQRVLPKYSINYLRDEVEARKLLLDELENMPLSHSLFASKCTIGERPSRT